MKDFAGVLIAAAAIDFCWAQDWHRLLRRQRHDGGDDSEVSFQFERPGLPVPKLHRGAA